MGQRLTVDICRNNKSIAAIYYHWSAYQVESVRVTKKIYEHVIQKANNMTDQELQLALIRFAENSTPQSVAENKLEREMEFAFIESQLKNAMPQELFDLAMQLKIAHGGLSPDDLQFAKQQWPNENFDQDDSLSRNEGLVGISQKSINMMKEIGSLVQIDLSNKQIHNQIFCGMSKDEYWEERDRVHEEYDNFDWEYPEIQEIEEVPIDLERYRFDQLEIVSDIILNNPPTWLKFDNKIYWVE